MQKPFLGDTDFVLLELTVNNTHFFLKSTFIENKFQVINPKSKHEFLNTFAKILIHFHNFYYPDLPTYLSLSTFDKNGPLFIPPCTQIQFARQFQVILAGTLTGEQGDIHNFDGAYRASPIKISVPLTIPFNI